ncbi:hypothetical protein MIDIC_230066 [Alphaproteobacteria bacterium]
MVVIRNRSNFSSAHLKIGLGMMAKTPASINHKIQKNDRKSKM